MPPLQQFLGPILVLAAGVSVSVVAQAPLPLPGALVAVADRGNSTYAPENTLPAIAGAVPHAHVCALDVRALADGTLVVIHDATVDRTTNGTGDVASFSLAGIRALDAGSWFSAAFTGVTVPTLVEALDACLSRGLTPLLRRRTGDPTAVLATLASLGALERVIVQSDDSGFLLSIHGFSPQLTLATQGSGPVSAGALAALPNPGGALALLSWTGADLDPRSIALIHQAGFQVYAEVFGSLPLIKKLRGLGADGAVTGAPVRVTQVGPSTSLALPAAAARIDVGPSGTATAPVAIVAFQTPGFGLDAMGENRGDIDLGRSPHAGRPGGFPLMQLHGVTFACLAEDVSVGVVEVPGALTDVASAYLGNATNGGVWLATSHNGNEWNIDTSVAHFPFAAGWSGAHVHPSGDVLAGRLPSGSSVQRMSTGRYRVTLAGIDPSSDGWLFAVGASDTTSHRVSSCLLQGTGWMLASRRYDQDRPAGTDAAFSFVHLPRTLPQLVAGRVGADGTPLEAVGAFSTSHPATGLYEISIPGVTSSAVGTLLVAACEEALPGEPDDDYLTTEFDAISGVFRIRSRDMPAGLPEDGAFVFAFVPFDVPWDTGNALFLSMGGEVGPGGTHILAFRNLGGVGGARYYTFLTPTSTAFPYGPWFGLHMDATELLLQLLATSGPFFGTLDAQGRSESLIVLPAPLGVEIQGVTVVLNTQGLPLMWTPPSRSFL